MMMPQQEIAKPLLLFGQETLTQIFDRVLATVYLPSIMLLILSHTCNLQEKGLLHSFQPVVNNGEYTLVLSVSIVWNLFSCSHLIFNASAGWYHDWVFLLPPQKPRMQIFHIIVCLNLTRLLDTDPHPLLGVNEVRGEEWQLLTAIHGKGDVNTNKVYNCTHFVFEWGWCNWHGMCCVT